jgi:biopolymer transport protein TolR
MGMNVGGGGKGRVTPQMNVTPLVDVVLVLLIIFMVVTPLLTKKMWLHVPKKDKVEQETPPPPPPDSAKPVVLTYDRDGTIKINSQVVSRPELSQKIKRVLAPRTEPLVFFDAQNDAVYGEAVEVMDLAREGGAVIAVLTESVAQ